MRFFKEERISIEHYGLRLGSRIYQPYDRKRNPEHRVWRYGPLLIQHFADRDQWIVRWQWQSRKNSLNTFSVDWRHMSKRRP